MHKANLCQRLHRSMLRLRMTEQRLADVYKEQIIRTPAHFGIGQEAIAVGVCEALMNDDYVYSHHRCHNHYLAKGGDLYSLVAELLGKEDGCSRGRGGSVHLTDRKVGFIASSAILGQTIAAAAGSALAFKMDRAERVAVTFFGDATLEEGIFWETLNYSAVHKLPVLFVCEDNGYSTESPPEMRQPAGTTLSGRVAGAGIMTKCVNGNDASEVYNAALEGVTRCRSGEGPYFLECTTYRWLEHVGPHFDHELNRTYRSREEVEAWMRQDPLDLSVRGLKASGLADDDDLARWAKEIEDSLDSALATAREAPWPDTNRLFDDVY